MNGYKTWKYVTIGGLRISLKLHAAIAHCNDVEGEKLNKLLLCLLLQCSLNNFGSHMTPSCE